MIQFQNVSFSYDKKRPILNGITFQIGKGESVGLVGANGAGKSTLLKLLLGLEYGAGEIIVDGIRVEPGTLPEIRRKVGFVLQNSDNQMFMPTVLEDMTFGLLSAGWSREDAEKKADEVLAHLHLEGLKYRHNHKLSGGEKKMAAIAVVLAMEPEVIVMDEPVTSLDPYNRKIVTQAILELPQTRLITSHDLDLIRKVCSRVILIEQGQIGFDGDPWDESLERRFFI